MKRFILSDESVNSYGFIVETKGGDLNRFLKNPVMFYNHDWDDAIGTWKDLKVDGSVISAIPEFDNKDKHALKILSKVEQGILKATSIGINILEYTFPVDSNEPYKITRWELMEASIATIPSNKNAVKMSYKGESFDIADNTQREKLTACLSADSKPIDIKTNINTDKMEKVKFMLGNTELSVSKAEKENIENFISKLSAKNTEKDTLLSANETEIIELKVKVKDFNTEVETLKGEKVALTAELETTTKQLNVKLQAEKALFIDNSITEGKFKAEQRETLIKLSATPEGDAMVKDLAKNAKVEIEVPDDAKLSVDGSGVGTGANKTFEEMTDTERKNLSDEQPEIYKKLATAYYNA